MKIIEPLKYRDYARGLWITTAPFVFEWRGRVYTIPAGFVCDFFSIPKPFRFWRGNNRGYGNEPSLIHDFLLRFRDYFGLGIMDCHAAFRDFMRLLGFGRSGEVKYYAVVVGGWVCPGAGDGTPPRDVRRAMRRNGDCWEALTSDVIRLNPEVIYAS